jgi:uncharacterized RDD family membrane protein YckC
METINVKTSQHIDIDYPVAGLGERVAARAIDLGIFFALYVIFIIISLATATFMSRTVMITFLALLGSLFVFYNLFCEVFLNGQSIGKKILKIKVISLDGSQPSIGQYTIRWLFRLVDFWLTGQVLGLIMVAVSENKQRVGDLVAKTTLIKTVIKTKIQDIEFHSQPDYIPVFNNANDLQDKDIELIHEVLVAYYKTYNPELINIIAEKITTTLGISVPPGMDKPVFLQTVLSDYNHLNSVAE